jgi:hypothetical protein
MHDRWSHIEYGYSQRAVPADQPLRVRMMEQRTAYNNGLNARVVFDRLEERAQAFGVVQATLVAELSGAQTADALDCAIGVVGNEGGVLGKGSCIAVLKVPWRQT